MQKRVFLSLIMLASSLFAASFTKQNNVRVSADTTPIETELLSNQLGVTLIESTTTDLTQNFTFSFSTNKVIYASSRYTTCKVIVTDPAFENDGVDHSVDKLYPEFTASIYEVSGSADVSKAMDVIIPKSVICFNSFKLNITGIFSNCINQNKKYISRIVIPDSVAEIPSDAFSNVWDNTQFYFVGATQEAGWENGWNQGHDITGHNSFVYESNTQSKEAINASYSIPQSSNNGYQFILGSYLEDVTNYNQPLALKYDLITSNGTTRNTALFKYKSSSRIDRIGAAAGGEETVKLNITVDKDKNDSIDLNTLVISNIYKYSGNPQDVIDFGFGPCFAKVTNITTNKSLDSFVTFSASNFSVLGDYTQFSVLVDEVPGIFEVLNPQVYQQFKNEIDNGTCVIRYRFTSIYESSFRITYVNKNNEVKVSTVKVSSPFSFFNLESTEDNRVGFLFNNKDVGDDFKSSKITNIQLVDFYIALDVYSYDTHNVASAQATVYTKFGRATLFDLANNGAIKEYNLDVILLVVVGSAIGLYLMVAVILFFTYKNVFKNDEFRRLKPKQFIKKGIIYFIGYMFIILSILFITFRWGFLYNTIVVYNPIDALVIVFTLAGAISLGLFIKELVVAVRANKKRKENKKLHIDGIENMEPTK